MKKLFLAIVPMMAVLVAQGLESVSYSVSSGGNTFIIKYFYDVTYAQIGCGNYCAISETLSNDLSLKLYSHIKGRPLTIIATNAFSFCDKLTSIDLPSGVITICPCAFKGCTHLSSPCFPLFLSSIGDEAFNGCLSIREVTIPRSVTNIGSRAFANCENLTNVVFQGDCPKFGREVFDYTPANLTVTINDESIGWDDVRNNQDSPWGDRRIVIVDANSGTSKTSISLTTTNIVVHYIQTSEQSPMAAPISTDVGIVNVMTEVMGGNVAIPESWAANYAGFVAMYGSDFSKALTTKSGKYDAANNPMFVWQDYVAGTDPTDETSVFRASVTMVDGVPVISYTPQLSEAEAAKRTYTIWGKEKLQDQKWVEVPSGDEANYNFFKVTVEMK